MALNIHDALIALAPVSKAKLCLQIMKEHAEEPIIVKPSMPELVVPAELGISLPDQTGVRRWSTIEKIKSLDDMDPYKIWTPKKKKAIEQLELAS